MQNNTENCKFETFPKLGCFALYLHQRFEKRFAEKIYIHLRNFELMKKWKIKKWKKKIKSFADNPGQNIRSKVKKSSKIDQQYFRISMDLN